MLLSNSTSVAAEVKLDALFVQRPAGSPQGAIALDAQLAPLPGVLNHAAQWCNNNQTSESTRYRKQTLQHPPTT